MVAPRNRTAAPWIAYGIAKVVQMRPLQRPYSEGSSTTPQPPRPLVRGRDRKDRARGGGQRNRAKTTSLRWVRLPGRTVHPETASIAAAAVASNDGLETGSSGWAAAASAATRTRKRAPPMLTTSSNARTGAACNKTPSAKSAKPNTRNHKSKPSCARQVRFDAKKLIDHKFSYSFVKFYGYISALHSNDEKDV